MSEFSVPPVASGGARSLGDGTYRSAWPFLSAFIYADVIAALGLIALAVAAMEYSTVSGCPAGSWPVVASILAVGTMVVAGLFVLLAATDLRGMLGARGVVLAGRIALAVGLAGVLVGLLTGGIAIWVSALQTVTCS